MMEHSFTQKIKDILASHFGEYGNAVYENSELIQYLNLTTRAAEKGSKSRKGFGNLYAIYVLVEDYVEKGFVENPSYSTQYEGARFTDLLSRARKLPFGERVQNHYFNNRVNTLFSRLIPNSQHIPIVPNSETKRYFINEHLLKLKIGQYIFNVSQVAIEIIDEFIKIQQDAFQEFIETCKELQKIENESPQEIESFIFSKIAPNADARLFEIVSYAILKFYYHEWKIFWGFEKENLTEENLKLFKTGRTNANDGGIDFVMKPLGRFFQVTETLDFKKYFLDIDKIAKYPITFVVKSEEAEETLKKKLYEDAVKSIAIEAIVRKYMSSIEELINIPKLAEIFRETIKQGHLNSILNEIITQSKVEFNYQDDEE
jgi:hypothetical protein